MILDGGEKKDCFLCGKKQKKKTQVRFWCFIDLGRLHISVF